MQETASGVIRGPSGAPERELGGIARLGLFARAGYWDSSIATDGSALDVLRRDHQAALVDQVEISGGRAPGDPR